MTDLAEFEARMRLWEDTEAIKRLKYKYWRCLDRKSKHWHDLDKKVVDQFMDLFCEDAVAYYPTGNFEGRETIVRQLMRDQGPVLFVNQGHNPEITFTSETVAKGVWLWSG